MNFTIQQSESAKLLGIEIDEDQNWNTHFHGKKGLIKTLNQRLYLIRRISNHLPKKKLKKIIDSIWTSKLRYGIQLCTQVRVKKEDRKSYNMKTLQMAQNKLLRVMNNCRIKDRISTKTMLEKFNMLSVNQLAAQVKLVEVWKSQNDPKCPIKMKRKMLTEEERTRSLRPGTRRDLVEDCRTRLAKSSFGKDASRIWNQAPEKIKEAKSLLTAKRRIKEHCKLLPV